MLAGFQPSTGPADVFFGGQRRRAVIDPVGFGLLHVADHYQGGRYRQTCEPPKRN